VTQHVFQRSVQRIVGTLIGVVFCWGILLFAKNPSQIHIPKMEFVGGYPNEWCIFIDNLTDDEKAEITDLNGRHISLQEIGI